MGNKKFYTFFKFTILCTVFAGVLSYSPLKNNTLYSVLESKKIIDTIYADLHKGFSLSVKKQKEFIQNPEDATYGEITHQGAEDLFKYLQLREDDVFYDLGSGVGKLIVQSYLVTPAKKVVGIELSSLRAIQAKKAFKKMLEMDLIHPKKNIDFIEGDFLKQSLNDATVIYICDVSFSDKLMKKISAKISKLNPGIRVISYKNLNTFFKGNKFRLEDTKSYQTSWNKAGSSVHIYRINP
jgi:hypothetical protein